MLLRMQHVAAWSDTFYFELAFRIDLASLKGSVVRRGELLKIEVNVSSGFSIYADDAPGDLDRLDAPHDKVHVSFFSRRDGNCFRLAHLSDAGVVDGSVLGAERVVQFPVAAGDHVGDGFVLVYCLDVILSGVESKDAVLASIIGLGHSGGLQVLCFRP